MIEFRPYAIAHDQAGAGLRAYLPIATDARSDRWPRWPGWLVIAAFVVGLLVGARAAAAAPPAVRFVQPRVPIVLSAPTGTEIPVQLRIEPDADNRSYAIAWCDGAHAHTLDGADESAMQPAARPLLVRVAPGDCEFVASVFGAGGKVRARTSFVMHVCGGQDGDCMPGGSR
jgi:hypothetical protein